MSEKLTSGLINLQGKRTSERRLSLLQRSLDLGDYIKRPRRNINMVNTGRNQTPMASASFFRDNRTVPGHTNVRRGDLFGDQEHQHSDARGVILHNNDTFEASPASGARPGRSPDRNSPSQQGPGQNENRVEEDFGIPAHENHSQGQYQADDNDFNIEESHGTASESDAPQGLETEDERVNRRWLRSMRKEVTLAFEKLHDYEDENAEEEVIVEHALLSSSSF
ncbi:hypothetical protein R1sor_000967 [Riccia sorocarpa]|uniref:Uncharacterized protein n=1 Tax=Riccia sorocarpa TaxID=122646 RepID=A0ABD3GXV6_9MARC